MRLRNKFIIVAASLTILLFGGISWAQTNASGPGTQPQQPDEQINNSGEPIVAGKVSTINNNVLAITNEGKIAYNIDFSKAIIVKGNVRSSAADIAVGDYLLVQGTVNGAAVAASLIIDQAIVGGTASSTGSQTISGQTTTSSQTIESLPEPEIATNDIWGSIGGFFLNLFNLFRN
jgi:hypothetical protein